MTLSIVHGEPLDTEPFLGPLTIGGFAREVTRRHGNSEAIVTRAPDGRISWTYDDLWERSVEVAKALVAAGMGRDARVGILMTNRPEYLSALFGIALAGGVAEHVRDPGRTRIYAAGGRRCDPPVRPRGSPEELQCHARRARTRDCGHP